MSHGSVFVVFHDVLGHVHIPCNFNIAVDFSINEDYGHQHNASPVRWRAIAIVTAITIQTIIPASICEIFGCIKHLECAAVSVCFVQDI